MQWKTRNKISEFMAGAFAGLVLLAILAAVLGGHDALHIPDLHRERPLGDDGWRDGAIDG